MVSSFVGRRDELAALMTLAGRLAEGHSIAEVIVGDPGSGKTRLLNEFRQRVTDAELPAVTGFETARGLPLAAAADLLRSLTTARAEGARLRTLLYEESPRGTGPELLRIFESAHRCLSELDRVVLIVDDLQWVDGPTVALCSLSRPRRLFDGPTNWLDRSRATVSCGRFLRRRAAAGVRRHR